MNWVAVDFEDRSCSEWTIDYGVDRVVGPMTKGDAKRMGEFADRLEPPPSAYVGAKDDRYVLVDYSYVFGEGFKLNAVYGPMSEGKATSLKSCNDGYHGEVAEMIRPDEV